jgi:hypothetical protein
MNYYFTGILIIVMVLLALLGGPARSAETQTNTSGSNTSIEGGYTGGATTYESGSTSSTTSTNSSTSNIKSSPPTANAPSFSAQSQDVCATGMSAGVQTFGLGFSGGKTFRDMNCERIEDLYKTTEKLEIRIDNMMHNKINIEFLKKQTEKLLEDVENLKDKVRQNGNGNG